jgi:N4-gp56 family major capsid protein
MAITNFIPELWAAMLLERWENEKVLAGVLDRRYEGTATRGNTVHIAAVVTPSVKDYKAANRTTSPDDVSDTGVDLLIDQEKNFDIRIQDIDAVQAAGSLEDYVNAAGDALVEDADQFIADLLVTGGTSLAGSAPTTGDNAFDLFVEAHKQLNINKAPTTGRVAVINPAFEAVLLKSDSKLTSVDTSGDNNGLRGATVGKVLNFRTVRSNNLPDSDDPQAVFLHPSAAAYVSQIDTVEALRDNNSISDRWRGLHVYGGKVVRALGVLVFNQAGS